jgi:hypothetical protein
MATTSFREDWLGRDLVNPTTNARDHLGRTVTPTIGYTGAGLRRTLRPVKGAVTLGQELQTVAGAKYVVMRAGRTGKPDPKPPAVGATVTDGTAVLRRQR